MASKPGRHAGQRPAAAAKSSREQVEYLIEKGRYKEAVKEVKIGFRREGTPELQLRRLLERAYYLYFPRHYSCYAARLSSLSAVA